ncbi:hypothetical protein GT347_25475 [Xylophilus rhododendri]|uniref:Uncharacterized protein n=1 Tax=Xylophilus rhododendri TaxID=2697032 RepID=A0A857JAJ7_9BURK|nr:hypothetical protein [Xylophilus rhododendri]QHJ01041.1 hypothetical protein GT347_25475 [Xylophilus rhododendri]
MNFLLKLGRITFLLVLVLVTIFAAGELMGRHFGDRIYLRNASPCTIVMMSEHQGIEANPGESVLIKAGFIDRTPTMLITRVGGIWQGGLHFSIDNFSVRDQPDRAIPPDWIENTLRGRKLTYVLDKDGQISVISPNTKATMQFNGTAVRLGATSGASLCPA